MDQLDNMRLFARVVERRSFTEAAADLRLPRSTATEALKILEKRLGVRLLNRTTRHVTPTPEGDLYYTRCLSILADIEDAEAEIRNAAPRGLLRIDAHPLLTQTFVLPHLPEFMARYPLIDLHIGQGDRYVDLVREGVDCAIRAGAPADSDLIMRPLAEIEEVTCASPDYLARHNPLKTPDDLAGHQMIGFISSKTGDVMPLEFTVNGKVRYETLPCRIKLNHSDTMVDLAKRGFGLIQAPRYRFEDDFATGKLVQVLPDFPPTKTKLTALYASNRQLAPRVRVFLDWIVGIFREAKI